MLQAQLQALERGAEQRTKGKVSLLYTPEQAADIDVQSLYSAALNGEAQPACSPAPGLAPAPWHALDAVVAHAPSPQPSRSCVE